MTTRVLFVDDEQAVVDALRRRFRPMREEWDMGFCTDAESALADLHARQAEVLVTDIRMPGVSGVDLLQLVKAEFPSMVRFVLSGHVNHASSLKLTGLAHQFLAKPCDSDELRTALDRAMELRRRLVGPGLLRLISEMGPPPPAPELFDEVVRIVTDPDSSVADIGKAMSRDTVMTEEVLRLVNSSFFGLRHQVTEPALAITLLGLNTITALVLGIHVFAAERDPRVAERVEAIRRTTTAAAGAAREIATTEGLSRDAVSDFYLAGMMHDVGSLMLASEFPERYLATLGDSRPLHAEEAQFGSTHQQVGAYLLGLWGLPDSIVESTAFHHTPEEAPEWRFSPLAVTHVVAAVADAGPGGDPDIDVDFIEAAGVLPRLDAWIVAAEEAMRHA